MRPFGHVPLWDRADSALSATVSADARLLKLFEVEISSGSPLTSNSIPLWRNKYAEIRDRTLVCLCIHDEWMLLLHWARKDITVTTAYKLRCHRWLSGIHLIRSGWYFRAVRCVRDNRRLSTTKHHERPPRIFLSDVRVTLDAELG